MPYYPRRFSKAAVSAEKGDGFWRPRLCGQLRLNSVYRSRSFRGPCFTKMCWVELNCDFLYTSNPKQFSLCRFDKFVAAAPLRSMDLKVGPYELPLVALCNVS